MGIKIRTGIIGLGYMGSIHLSKIIKNRNISQIAIYDIDRQKYQTIRQKGIIFCKSIDELSNNIDGVIISSPSSSHYGYLTYFLKKGIHCLCEKPPVLSYRQLIKLIKIAKKNNTIFNVVMPERENPVVKRILKYSAHKGFAFFSDRVAPFSRRSTDISVLFDLMIHDIDIMISIFDDPIRSINADGIKLITNTVDLLNVRIEFKNGGFAILNASRAAFEKKRNIRAFYSGGYFSANLIDGTYHTISTVDKDLNIYKDRILKKKIDPITNIDNDFISSIIRKKESRFSATTLLPVMDLCEKIKKRIISFSVSDIKK